MALNLQLIMVAVFSSIFLLVLSIALPAVSSRKTKKALKHLEVYEIKRRAGEVELAQPMLDRVILPRLVKLKEWVKKKSPTQATESIRERLTAAGTPLALDVDSFISLKITGSLIGGLLALTAWVVWELSFTKGLLSIVGAVIFGFYAPDIWLAIKIKERQKKVRLALADTLDLLSIAVEAGLGFDSALTKVIQNVPGPLSEEFFRALQEMQMGISRKDTLRALNARMKVDELHSFIIAIVQADVFGVSISQVLRVQAKEMRIRRLQRAEEIAVKAPVKMVFPLLLCVFPALFVVIVGPAAIRIIDTIFSMF